MTSFKSISLTLVTLAACGGQIPEGAVRSGLRQPGTAQVDSSGISRDYSSRNYLPEQGERAEQADLIQARAELLSADLAYSDASAQTNLVEGITSMLADEGSYIIGASPFLTTPAEVRAALAASPANLTRVQTWTPIRVDVSGDGTVGYTYGFFEIRGADGSLLLPGKYIAFFRKEGGEWKVSAYKRVPRPAGEISLTPPEGFGSPDYRRYRSFPGSGAAEAEQAVKDADLTFNGLAASTSTSNAFATYAAEDGANVGNGANFTFGPAAIGQVQAAYPAGTLAWYPVHAESARSADLAVTTGEAEVRNLNPDGSYTVLGKGKYLTVWKRQRTGEWKFVIDG